MKTPAICVRYILDGNSGLGGYGYLNEDIQTT